MCNFHEDTLQYEINVPVRLLISEIFSGRNFLILDGMFIEIRISDLGPFAFSFKVGCANKYSMF